MDTEILEKRRAADIFTSAMKAMAGEILWTIKGEAESKFRWDDESGCVIDISNFQKNPGNEDFDPEFAFDPVEVDVFHMSVAEDAIKHAAEIVPWLVAADGSINQEKTLLAGRLVGQRMAGCKDLPALTSFRSLPGEVVSLINAIPIMEISWNEEERRPVLSPAASMEPRP